MKCVRCHRDIPEESVYCMFCGKPLSYRKRQRKKNANGEGGAYSRGGTWTAKWTSSPCSVNEDGGLIMHRKTKGGFKTRKEAENYARDMVIRGTEERICPTVREYWDIIERKDLPTISKGKQTDYRKAWSRLSDIHDIRVDKLYLSDLQRIIDREGKTHATARLMKNLLQKVFNLATGDGFVNKDMPSLIKIPAENKKPREAFTEQEINQLWEAYEHGIENIDMILLMIYTGMMPGEIISLRPGNVKDGVISGVGMKTEVRKQSPIVLSDKISSVMDKAVLRAKNTLREYVFPETMNKLYRAYYIALEQAGVRKLPPYSCRHTTATVLAVKRDVDPVSVKKVMRWASTNMIDNYAHPDIEDIKETVDKM